MLSSFVVTGGGRGIGRAIVERLLHDGHGVAVLEFDEASVDWAETHRYAHRLATVVGDAADVAIAERAAYAAERIAPLAGWVNNAAAFRDAFLHEDPAAVLEFIELSLGPAVVGTGVAARRLRVAGRAGSIVNVSSHQAARPVAGAAPYAIAKAAVEGLTRAAAVDYGSSGIRVNAVALGTIATARFTQSIGALDEDAAAARNRSLAELHTLGRIGHPDEVAATVAYLLSEESSFISGTVIPVDGGRAALGHDPEARHPS